MRPCGMKLLWLYFLKVRAIMVARGLFAQGIGGGGSGGVDGVCTCVCVCVLYLLPTYRD